LKVTEPGGRVTTYTYNTAGNRATETVVSGGVTTTTTYSYNTRGWLTTTVAVSGNTTMTVTYAYDQNGNQISSTKETVEPATGGTISGGIFAGNEYVSYYTYDVWNNMTQSVSENNTVENYYDGNGLRYGRKVDDGTMTVSLYEYDKVILEVNGTSGAQTAVNVYGNQLISRNGDYYMYNGHGDVTMIVNTGGTVLASYYYDAFGVHLSSAGTVSNPYRYAGYMFDEETGLYYLNSRYYDPETARFLSEDTYLGSASDPLSLNLYAYVKYNPLKYYDPTGHEPIPGYPDPSDPNGYYKDHYGTPDNSSDIDDLPKYYWEDFYKHHNPVEDWPKESNKVENEKDLSQQTNGGEDTTPNDDTPNKIVPSPQPPSPAPKQYENYEKLFEYADDFYKQTGIVLLSYLRDKPSNGGIVIADKLWSTIEKKWLYYTIEERLEIFESLQELTDDWLYMDENGHVRIFIAWAEYVLLCNAFDVEYSIENTRPKGTELVQSVMSSARTTTIFYYDSNSAWRHPDANEKDTTNGVGVNVSVFYNPKENPQNYLALNGKNKGINGNDVVNGQKPNYISLGHELVHAYGYITGTSVAGMTLVTFTGYGHMYKDINTPTEELVTVGIIGSARPITENDLLKEHGYSLRGAYSTVSHK